MMKRSRASKRKTSSENKEETNGTSPEQQLPKASTKASSRGKRIKAPAAPSPHQEPETLSDKRNLVRLRNSILHFLQIRPKSAFPILGFPFADVDLRFQLGFRSGLLCPASNHSGNGLSPRMVELCNN